MDRGQSFDASQNHKTAPTCDDVEAIKQLMQDRFPQQSSEAHTFDINAELEDLRQQSEDTLLAYNKRARSVMERVGCQRQAPVATDSPSPAVPPILKAGCEHTALISYYKRFYLPATNHQSL